MKLTNRVLTQRAHAVTFDYPWQNRQLAQSMLRLMLASGGIGLAATQVGMRQRVFVMQVQGWQRSCFNPEITAASPELVEWPEGCLSFPGDRCIIQRPEWIDVRYQDYQGAWHSERFSGILARCYQHELDHLNGTTMWDRHKEQHAEQS
jgi:peptide deformylase